MTRTRVRRRRIGVAVGSLGSRVVLTVARPAAAGTRPRRTPRSGGAAPYVVRPGDTVCGASPSRVAPGADPRAVVDGIVRENGVDAAVARAGAASGPPAPCPRLDARRMRRLRCARPLHLVSRSTPMRCPWCHADDDKVVDSRPADGGGADPPPPRVPRPAPGVHHLRADRGRRPGRREARRRQGAVRPRQGRGRHRKAIEDRPVTDEQVDQLVDRVEERLRRKGPG